VSALEEELTDYYRMIVILENQGARESSAANDAKASAQGLTLKRLLVWTQDPLQRLKTVAIILEMSQGRA